MSAFDRLSPALQYQIVNTLGFSELRPVQDQSVDAILDGDNCVVLAPTAGGKTEAAFFPLLSQMDTQDWKPVSVLYIAPIRALLNNQESRLATMTAMVGRRSFKWHGDVTASSKRAFLNEPADVLLTTPESLEVMLMSRKVPARQLFRHLRCVVIDEVHAFVSDDRGGHLSAIIERLTRICGHDIQRIGLSATVGNPPTILEWAAGSSQRPGRVVDPRGDRAETDLSLDWVGNEANAAKVISRLHPGTKRLVFVDSRRGVESLGRYLRQEGVDTFVTHSSLSVEERRAAEQAFVERQNCVIVATSALELGIDIGDLDHVIQIDAPATVASFLQRMGRTGRRPDKPRPNCTFLCTKDDMLVQAAAIIHLYRQDFVEHVELRSKAAHLLAHQLMALSIQEQGIPESDWWAWVSPATPFRGLTEDDRRDLLAHMIAEDILVPFAGRLNLGARGEKLYGYRNFTDLYAVFSTPKSLIVLWGNQEIGSIDATFAEQQELAKLSFVLGARSWRATDINWKEGVIHVQPIEDSELARWSGIPKLLGHTLCQAMRAILTSDQTDDCWSRRAQEKLTLIRAEYADISPDGLDLVPDSSGYRLWTFAGGRANNLLARLLESQLGDKVTVDNRYIGFRDKAAESAVKIRNALEQFRLEGRPTHADAVRFAEACATKRLSKFQPCLPDRLESEYLAEVLTDPAQARQVLATAVQVHDESWGP